MDILGTIKKAPKGAWIAGGGVAIGIVAYRFTQSKKGETVDLTSADDNTAIGDVPTNYSGAAIGTVVPPVVITSPSTDDTPTGLIDTYIGALGQLFGGFGQLVSQQQDALGQQHDQTIGDVQVGADIVQTSIPIVTPLTGGGAPVSTVAPTSSGNPVVPPPNPPAITKEFADAVARNAGYPYWNAARAALGTGAYYKKEPGKANRDGNCWSMEYHVYMNGDRTLDWGSQLSKGNCK